MKKHLVNYLSHFNLLFANRSKSMAKGIFNYLRTIYEILDEGKPCLVIFTDISKAFDLVNYEILLYKLEKYRVRGIAKQWFTSYLFNRKQSVKINNYQSCYNEVSAGVLQGSILGPILFLLSQIY